MTGHINPLNPKLNPICHLLVLLGAHPILHISRIRVNLMLLQSCTDSLQVMADSSTETFPTSSGGTCNVGNVKAEEHTDIKEEEEMNVKTEEVTVSEEEECIDIKDEDCIYSEEERHGEVEEDVDKEEEEDVQIQEEVS
jgi:hypothetical protein